MRRVLGLGLVAGQRERWAGQVKTSRDGSRTLVRAALVGIVILFMAACGSQTPEQLLASAKDNLGKGDRNAAVIHLKNLLQKAPNNGEARLLLGQALFESEDYVTAEKELSRALELKQPQEKALPPYLLTLLALGKYQAVVTEAEKYRLFNPAAVATTQTAVGDAYRGLGNFARARQAYAAAIAAVPGYSRALLGDAILIAGQGELDQALQRTDAVIAADPKLVEARAFRGEILVAKGDRAGAKKAFEEAIQVNERYLPARLALVALLTDERDFDAAAKLVESTRKVAPPDLRINYADALIAFRTGDMKRARQQLQQVLKVLPDDIPSLVLAGAVELQDGQLTAAETSLRRVLAMRPTHLAARQLLTRTYLRMGQPAKAQETLQPFIARGLTKNPGLTLLAGEVLLANGDFKNAAAHFQQAAKGTHGQQVVARTRLGQIALATGRSAEGFKELEAASGLDEQAYQADLALFAGHLQRKEFDRALAALQSLEKKQPNNPLTFFLYGVVDLAKGDQPAARGSFDKALQLQDDFLPAVQSLGMLDLAEKRPDLARKRYEAAIAKNPGNEQLYLALATFQRRAGASQKEIGDTLQRAVKANPQAAAARVELIRLALQVNDVKSALAAAQDALAALPSDPIVLDAAGAAQEAAGDLNQAIATYGRRAALQPDAVEPLYRLAALHVRQKDTEGAIEALRRVKKVAPTEYAVVPQLANLYIAAGRYDEALREVRELQNREPKLAAAYSIEGDIHRSKKQFGDAERAYRQALKLEPKANAVAIRIHGVLADAGKSAEADAFARKWIADNPKDVAMPLYLSRRELAGGNLKAAAAQYQSVITISPSNAEALNNLAWIGGELGDPKALGYAEHAAKLEPNNANVLDTYGVLLVRRGEIDKGLPLLQQARELAPARNDIRLHYAKALIQAGRKDDARKELQALQSVKESFKGKDEVAALLKGL